MNDKDFSLLKKEVDSIQIQLAKESGSWMSKPSNIMALVAIIFSFGTTLVSAYNSHTQDIRENRKEARQLIQRLSKLPIESFELTERYKEKGAGQALSRMLSQENSVVAIQAAELIARFPNTFSSPEFKAVGDALATSNISHKVPWLYDQAILKANSSNEYLGACRSFAVFLFSKGDIAKGNTFFEMALNTWSKFPEDGSKMTEPSDFDTYYIWSESELGLKNVEKAIELANKADLILKQLPAGNFADNLSNQLSELYVYIDNVKNSRPRGDLQ